MLKSFAYAVATIFAYLAFGFLALVDLLRRVDAFVLVRSLALLDCS